MRDGAKLKQARELRATMTEAERRLWSFVRDRRLASAKFVRQLPIGPYVADFACRGARLIVEVDGSQHGENAIADERRTRHLADLGYRVLRVWNNDVLQRPDAVREAILAALERRS